MQPGAAVSVRALVVSRGGREVLHDLSFDVPRGRITGLLGPSGCGKSTLMRAIVGVQIVESGEVEVLGDPAGAPDLRRRVGYVTQAPSVYGERRRRCEEVIRQSLLEAPGPELVARAVHRALSARRPRLRYPVGPASWLVPFVRRLMPDSVALRLLRSHFRV